MPHIHTDSGGHDHTVSAYIIRLDFDEPKLVLHLHKKIGTYLNFGGHIEINENPWQAISHEILEESGYGMDQLKILQPKNRIKNISGNIVHPIPLTYGTHDISEIAQSSHFHTDTSFVFITGESPAHKISEGESTDILTIGLEEVMSRNDIKQYIKEVFSYIINEVLPNWEALDCSEFKD